MWHHLPTNLNPGYVYDFGWMIVLFFFVLSGFHITLSWKDRIKDHSKDFLVKRCAKVFPIQWITLALFIAFGVNYYGLKSAAFHFLCLHSKFIIMNPVDWLNKILLINYFKLRECR